jgi:hypothetical protein
LINEYVENYDAMTDQEMRSLADRSVALQRKRIDLRRDYFKRISKTISPKTAARFTQLEDRIDLLLNLQLAANGH